MIITCINCYKKFDINSNLIPDIGRLVQCASCDHKWFFKKEVLDKTVSPIVENIDSDTINIFDHNNTSNNYEINPSDLAMDEIEADTKEERDEKIEVNNKKGPEKKIDANINEKTSANTKPKKQRNFKILIFFIVAIISFVAFIIIVDTFKHPIEKIIPNIEFILYNLYESIKDISLFIKDLT